MFFSKRRATIYQLARLNKPEELHLQQHFYVNLEPTTSICWRMQLSYEHLMTLPTFLRWIRNTAFAITFISHYDCRYVVTMTVFLLSVVPSDQR